MIKVIICLLLLISYPAVSASPPPVREVTMRLWLHHVKVMSAKYGIDPNFALAVAEVESSNKEVRFRFGKMGKGTYYGPYGIHKCFLSKWAINDPLVNTEVGIRALARYKDQRKSLKRYNASFNEGYYRQIKKLERQNRESGILGYNIGKEIKICH